MEKKESTKANEKSDLLRRAKLLWRMSQVMAVLGFLSLVLPPTFLMIVAEFYLPGSLSMSIFVLGVMAFGTSLGFLGAIFLEIDARTMIQRVCYFDESSLQFHAESDSGDFGGSGGGKNAIEHTEAKTAKEGGFFCDGSSVCKKSDAFIALVKREARDLVNEIGSIANRAVDKLAQAMFGGTKQGHTVLAFATSRTGGCRRGGYGRNGGYGKSGGYGCSGGYGKSGGYGFSGGYGKSGGL